MSKPKELNAQQKLFCYHYAQLGDGREAAIRANYSDKSGAAKVSACALLKRPLIQQEIQRQLAEKERREKKLTEAVAFNALDELAEMAKSWRSDENGLQMCHVKAAEAYYHNSGQSPEAKKIMADIESRVKGVMPADGEEVYRSAWNQSSQKPN